MTPVYQFTFSFIESGLYGILYLPWGSENCLLEILQIQVSDPF